MFLAPSEEALESALCQGRGSREEEGGGGGGRWSLISWTPFPGRATGLSKCERWDGADLTLPEADADDTSQNATCTAMENPAFSFSSMF